MHSGVNCFHAVYTNATVFAARQSSSFYKRLCSAISLLIAPPQLTKLLQHRARLAVLPQDQHSFHKKRDMTRRMLHNISPML